MFALPESWVWDFWLADDGENYHLFFLYASRALPRPDDRHYRASIGHATSADLTNWDRVQDVMVRSDAPAFDDLATWTGSVVRHPDGTWFLFYTGVTLTERGNRQQIGYATSADLLHWRKSGSNPLLCADSRWYETLADGQWHDEAFRDPWVFADPDGNGWHMLITARANYGRADDRGVIGHARSPDLRTWVLGPPLTEPGQGFGQLEVTQVEIVDGRPVLLFSCLDSDVSKSRLATGTTGGVWWAGAQSLLGPFQIADAQQLTDRRRYSGRIIRNRDSDDWTFLAFDYDADDGGFVGTIADPQPIQWTGPTLALGSADAGIRH
ncbi:glycoside hydrolase family 68 protein [Nakamurella sp. PAMC28650]|uniref:family 43 glycosylhydrolase n=1 Tax=Nakamurella sp. PAMC28650 TaxID=2762325 RepID=UPI00164D6A44|nr:glycoside hydrolase family 68 protein [Nakamurella sp. PAMC28650]QNK80777.1 family 43 glycosylhydrolase [Nakamurella sp. PAMC28650]